MKKLLLLLLCVPLIGLGQQTINGSITHGGLQRDYILYVPASYSTATTVPLVFNFHGYTSNATEQMWYGDFRTVADTAGFIIVHPEGTLDNTGTSHWNVGWGGSTVDDIGFTEALMDNLSLVYNIDISRIYSTGMSNGGFMSYQLACELSDRIAAIASVTGSMSTNLINNCSPNHQMPVMEIHGTADAVVPYSALPSIMDFWANFNNCNSTPIVTNVPDINITDGCTAEHQIWENGDNGATIEHFKIINGGHTWPGTIFSSTGTNQDINASAEIWRFFSQYDINGLIGTTTLIDNTTIKDKRLVKITDILGREINRTSNALLFYIYDDGTVEKKIIIE
jgi:polyhydroxybutyrate depolymerase